MKINVTTVAASLNISQKSVIINTSLVSLKTQFEDLQDRRNANIQFEIKKHDLKQSNELFA